MRLVLGSASRRRLELLRQLGIVPDAVLSPNVDESPHAGELPGTYCRRVARAKTEALPCEAGDVVLCADTTVALGRRILGKPANASEAADFLRSLSGRRHRVLTSVAVKSERSLRERLSQSVVRFKRLSESEIEGYLDSGDWMGKAGGYAIQGPAAAFIPWMQGSHSGIVGLPLHETATLLRAAGLRIPEIDAR